MFKQYFEDVCCFYCINYRRFYSPKIDASVYILKHLRTLKTFSFLRLYHILRTYPKFFSKTSQPPFLRKCKSEILIKYRNSSLNYINNFAEIAILSFDFFVSEEDYLNFNLYHSYHSKQAKYIRLFSRYVCAVIFLLFYYTLALRNNNLLVYNIIIGLIIPVLWVILFPKYYDNRVKKITKKHISEGKNNDFIGMQRLTLNDDSIEEVSVNSIINTKYNAIEKIAYGYNSYYIYTGAIKAFIVPISAFKNEEQKNDFLAFLLNKTGLPAAI